MNPELQKHLWVEMSLHKVLATPVLLAIIVFMGCLVIEQPEERIRLLDYFFPVLFWGFTSIGGSYMVAKTLQDEHSGKTWDWVRLNRQSPWSITWGSILGASSFMWYVGAWCMAAYLCLPFFATDEAPLTIHANRIILLIELAFFLQGIGMLSTCLTSTSNNTATSKRGNALGLLFLSLMLFPYIAWQDAGTIHWYRWTLPALTMTTISTGIFAAWAWVGSLRLLREQLQYRNGSLVWIAFVLFLMVYTCGFAGEIKKNDFTTYRSILALIGFSIAFFMSYAMLFFRPPSPQFMNNLLVHIQIKSWKRVEESLPLWFISFVICIFLLPIILLIKEEKLSYIILSLMILFVRDGAILTAFNYGKRPQNATMTTLIYLFFLYVVIPIIAVKASDNNFDVLQYFLPGITSISPFYLFVHALIACLWAGSRIYRHQKLLRSPQT